MSNWLFRNRPNDNALYNATTHAQTYEGPVIVYISIQVPCYVDLSCFCLSGLSFNIIICVTGLPFYIHLYIAT